MQGLLYICIAVSALNLGLAACFHEMGNTIAGIGLTVMTYIAYKRGLFNDKKR